MSPGPRAAQSDRDVYANLLRDTRGLRRDQASAREVWFVTLPWERKEETLFELEMLLKGIVCFGNPRNLSGKPRRTPAVAHDFHDDLRTVREGLDRVVALVRQILGQKDRAYTFTRYLETVLPEDTARSQLIKDQLAQDTPEEALFLLRNAFSSALEIADGLTRLGRLSHRLFFALHGQVTREVGRNAFFNPLVALEFRPELDRIRSAEVLEALHAVDGEAAHRVCALTFLTLFRALRYVQLIDEYAQEVQTARRAHLILAVMRSDLRALTRFLAKRAGDLMADGLERDMLSVPLALLDKEAPSLEAEARRLAGLRQTLDTIAATLRIEVRKAYERDLPAPDDQVSDADLGAQLIVVSATLRATFQNAIEVLCSEIQPEAPTPQLAATLEAQRAHSARLRREVWMFAQILRAFLAKATAATGGSPDAWAGYASFQFVREFLGHFRAIGYQLVRQSDYERLDPFLTALEDLRDVDLLDPERMAAAVDECQQFQTYLEELYDRVSKRVELAEAPFDKKDAAELLKIYLGAQA